MAESRKVVIDTNVVSRLNVIDGDCTLMDLIVETYGDEGIGDHAQLRLKKCCTHLPSSLSNHNITDEEVASFVLGYEGKVVLNKIMLDPADLKLFLCALKNRNAILISCDRRLLMLGAETNLRRSCFKAAIHQVHNSIGGLFGDKDYSTEHMFELAGTDTFFHYACSRRCAACDPKNQCPTRKTPPTGNS